MVSPYFIFIILFYHIFYYSAILSALIGSCSSVYISKGEDDEVRLQVIESSNATGVIDPITGLLGRKLYLR